MANALTGKGIAFSEQVPMFDKFLVDFKLNNYPIIIQRDGDYWHNRPHVRSRDKGQDRYLAKSGYMVLRFDDKQILNNIDGCLSLIKSAIKNPAQSPLMPYI